MTTIQTQSASNSTQTHLERPASTGMTTAQTQSAPNSTQTPVEIPINRRSDNRVITTQSSIDRGLAKVYSVKEMIELAKRNEFPQRVFIIDGVIKTKTPITHFFELPSILKKMPSKDMNLLWRCKICPEDSEVLRVPFHLTSNLRSHLNIHASLRDWLVRYQKYRILIFRFF